MKLQDVLMVQRPLISQKIKAKLISPCHDPFNGESHCERERERNRNLCHHNQNKVITALVNAATHLPLFIYSSSLSIALLSSISPFFGEHLLLLQRRNVAD